MRGIRGYYCIVAAITGYICTVVFILSALSVFGGLSQIAQAGASLIFGKLGFIGAATGTLVAHLFRKPMMGKENDYGTAYLIGLTNVALFCICLAAFQQAEPLQAIALYGIAAIALTPLLLGFSIAAWHIMRWADRNDAHSLWDKLHQHHA